MPLLDRRPTGRLNVPGLLGRMREQDASVVPLHSVFSDKPNPYPAWNENLPDDPKDRATEMAMNFMPMGMVKALPMDHASRMARAEKMGFDVEAYKGADPYNWRTGEEITEFSVPKNDAIKSMYPDYVGAEGGHAGFFTDNPSVSNKFGTVTEGGASYPVKLKFEDPLVIDAKGKPARAFQFERSVEEFGTRDDYESVRNAFRGVGGYDGVVLKNTADEGTVYIPLKPKNVRSRFATFDPAKANSPDLLAAGLPFGLMQGDDDGPR